jgi:hypothetical protein
VNRRPHQIHLSGFVGITRRASLPSGSTSRSSRCSLARVSAGWRRERDSNPRYGFPYSGFQDHRHRPLGHPSASRFWPEFARGTQNRRRIQPSCHSSVTLGRALGVTGSDQCSPESPLTQPWRRGPMLRNVPGRQHDALTRLPGQRPLWRAHGADSPCSIVRTHTQPPTVTLRSSRSGTRTRWCRHGQSSRPREPPEVP